MSFAQTSIDICNRALTQVGCQKIASFSADSTESAVAGQHYEATLIEELSKRRWRFATKMSTPLNRLVTPPASEWGYAYQLPADVVVLQAIRCGGREIEYEIFQDRIYTESNSDTLIAE